MKSKTLLTALKSLERSGTTGFSLNQLRVIIALERLVARFETNQILSQHLIFKGGFALIKHLNSARFTHDLDASYFLFPLDKLVPMIIDSITTKLKDGMWYGDVKHEKILLNKEYDGVRFNCAFQIGDPPDNEAKIKKLSRVHFDIGLSDEKFPQFQKTQMPSLLHSAFPVSWSVYPLEQIFSEKLQTFVNRGGKNSRAKDIYDLVSIYPNCSDVRELDNTIRRVFKDRNTELPRSFREFAQGLDQTFLNAAWNSVVMPEPRSSFAEIWRNLLDVFSDIENRLR